MSTVTDAEIEAFRAAMPFWWRFGAVSLSKETEDIRRVLEAAAAARPKIVIEDPFVFYTQDL